MNWAELGRKRLAELRLMAGRPRAKRWFRIVLVTTLSLFLLYLAVGNWLLRFGGLEKLVNGSATNARLSLGPSYTWFPGYARVRDLTLRFEDQNVQFEIVVPRGKATLNPFALLRKRLHLRSLDADGVRFRFRHKVTSVAGNEKRLAHFPRIEGFADPPLLKPAPPSDKSDDWAFLLENVSARGDELWFMEYRFVGRVDVRGAFELVPGKKLWVGPARADFRSGKLVVGAARPFVKSLRGSMDFRFAEANPDPIPGLQIFRQISSKIALDAELLNLEPANLYLSDASRLEVTRGAGEARVQVDLVNGRFAQGSLLTLRTIEDVRVGRAELALAGRLNVDVRSPATPEKASKLVVETVLASAALDVGEPQQSRKAGVRAERLRAMVETDGADVTKPWKLAKASLGVDGGRVEHLGALTAAASKEPPVSAGAAWFFAHAELTDDKTWSGAVRADARRMRVRLGDEPTLLDATLSAAAESPQSDLENGVVRDLSLVVRGAERPARGKPLEVNVRIPRITWSGFPPDTARGRATLGAPSVEPILETLGAPAVVVGVWPDAPLEASARLTFERPTLDIELDLAETGPLRALGRLRVCSPARGAFLLKSGAFTLGFLVRGGSVEVQPQPPPNWLVRNAPSCPSKE